MVCDHLISLTCRIAAREQPIVLDVDSPQRLPAGVFLSSHHASERISNPASMNVGPEAQLLLKAHGSIQRCGSMRLRFSGINPHEAETDR
jgi:hypothetical protein